MEESLDILTYEIKARAEAGDAEAQYSCYAYELIFGSESKAKDWLRKSADNGYAQAQAVWGSELICGEDSTQQDVKKGVEYVKKSASQDNAAGQHLLGRLYAEGQGVKQNSKEAVKWFIKSAEQGNDDAQSDLASCYLRGDGVEKDYEIAVQLYRLSAEQENVEGLYGLGFCYVTGWGVPGGDNEENTIKGIRVLRLAADQDHEKSQQLLDRLDERLQNLVSKGNKDAIKLQKMIEDLDDDDDVEDLSEILDD